MSANPFLYFSSHLLNHTSIFSVSYQLDLFKWALGHIGVMYLKVVHSCGDTVCSCGNIYARTEGNKGKKV